MVCSLCSLETDELFTVLANTCRQSASLGRAPRTTVAQPVSRPIGRAITNTLRLKKENHINRAYTGFFNQRRCDLANSFVDLTFKSCLDQSHPSCLMSPVASFSDQGIRAMSRQDLENPEIVRSLSTEWRASPSNREAAVSLVDGLNSFTVGPSLLLTAAVNTDTPFAS